MSGLAKKFYRCQAEAWVKTLRDVAPDSNLDALAAELLAREFEDLAEGRVPQGWSRRARVGEGGGP